MMGNFIFSILYKETFLFIYESFYFLRTLLVISFNGVFNSNDSESDDSKEG